MSTQEVSRDFDTLSSVYDETRSPLDPGSTANLKAFLDDHGWTHLLEVGVGTGRIARTLLDQGLRVVGLDASLGMLRRAAQKRIPDLVHGTAYRLPFPGRTFDVTLFVHVLHILDEPSRGISEASRVSRSGVLAIVDSSWNDPARATSSPRALMREVLAEVGYPNLLRLGPRVKEREILTRRPPAETRVLSDREVTEPLAKALEPVAKRAYRHTLSVPPEELDRAVALARAKVGDRTVTFRRSESVVWWPTSD